MTLADRAAALIPGGVNTFSKAVSQYPPNAPTHLLWGHGAHVGNRDVEFIDWTMGLGAVSLGYADPEVDEAVQSQVALGPLFGLSHEIEVEFAEGLVPLLPWPDAMVRFGKNGSDATSGAVRAARAITGRDVIASSGYHGWQDWTCPNKTGVPTIVRALTHSVSDPCDLCTAPFPDIYACLIIEPDAAYDLAGARKWCDANGIILIFDEVLTGFRVPELMWAKWKGVTPDLICFAKAIANGYPLSVIAGPRKYMEVFGGAIGYSFTFAGDAIGLAAGLATVRKYKREPVVDRMWEVGGWVRDAWEDATEKLGLEIYLKGYNSRLLPQYRSLAERSLFTQEMVRRGILMTTTFFSSCAHTDEDVEQTAGAIRESLAVVAAAGDAPERLIEGPVCAMPFRAMTSL